MLNKKYSPKGKSCKVTFELPAEVATDRVAVLGEFNDWNAEEHIMSLKKTAGVWQRTIALKPGQSYEFRYLIDGSQWHNETEADSFSFNSFGTKNSVVEI